MNLTVVFACCVSAFLLPSRIELNPLSPALFPAQSTRSASSSLTEKKASFSFSQVQEPLKPKLLKEAIQRDIHQEVQRSFKHLTPLLSTWLTFLLTCSTAIVLMTWLKVGRSTQKMKESSQEIESIKYDTLSQINYLATDVKVILEEIQETLGAVEDVVSTDQQKD